MASAGADIIDLGAESTRPGAAPVDATEELARLLPALRAIARVTTVPWSIDTYKSEVAVRALDEGASIVNDVSGFAYDKALAPLVASRGVPVILMHMRGRPNDMYAHANYADLLGQVAAELLESIDRATRSGVMREQIVLDPGLGFAKRAEQSMQVLAGLDRFSALGQPILVGASRKSFLVSATGPLLPEERDWPTAAAVTAAVLGGAHIVRVHNVEKMVPVVRVADALRAGPSTHGEAP